MEHTDDAVKRLQGAIDTAREVAGAAALPGGATHEGVIFWGPPEAEQLTGEDMDDAITAILEECWPGPLPQTVTVCGYRRMVVSGRAIDARDALEAILERLDEDYGDPDGEPSKPTPAMVKAAEALMATIKAEYEPWACEEVVRRVIDVQAWVRDHNVECGR